MTDINSLGIVGRLTKDAVITSTDSYDRVNFAIAVNRSKKVDEGKWEDEVSFFDVVWWGARAKRLLPQLTKGRQVSVSGYLKQDRWEKDGQKNSKVVIVAEDIMLGAVPAAAAAPTQEEPTF